jgi:hypothetical protein
MKASANGGRDCCSRSLLTQGRRTRAYTFVDPMASAIELRSMADGRCGLRATPASSNNHFFRAAASLELAYHNLGVVARHRWAW